MDFASVGKLNSYMKTVGMKNILKQNGNKPASGAIAGDPASLRPEQGESDPRLSSIVMKIESGEELTAEELEYLRNNAPDVYDSVMKLSREKKEYEEKLRQCKTKDDARILQMGKVAEALSAAKSAQARGDVAACVSAGAKLKAMTASYIKFTETGEYAKMAENHSELAEALKAAGEALEGKTGGEDANVSEETDAVEEAAVNEETDLVEEAAVSGETDLVEEAAVSGETDAVGGESGADVPSKPEHVENYVLSGKKPQTGTPHTAKPKAPSMPVRTDKPQADFSGAVKARNTPYEAKRAQEISNSDHKLSKPIFSGLA